MPFVPAWMKQQNTVLRKEILAAPAAMPQTILGPIQCAQMQIELERLPVHGVGVAASCIPQEEIR